MGFAPPPDAPATQTLATSRPTGNRRDEWASRQLAAREQAERCGAIVAGGAL